MRTFSTPTPTLPRIALLASIAILAGCSPTPEVNTLPPKPVKTEVVGMSASGDSASSFVGTLRARQRSDLGFETAGRIVAIAVEVGDRVSSGQVLARLDEAPARWRLEKAEADRAAASASLAERDMQLQQQETLARDKIISPTALESSRAAQRLARSQVEAADAALATARRELALTRIVAPFDGEVVGRLTQPYSDVAPGQVILQVQAGRALEVVTTLPDTVAGQLDRGSKARGSNSVGSFELELERVSNRSDNGSLVQAIYRVSQPNSSLRSGGVVSVELPRSKSQADITLPVAALLPGTQAKQASVFVMDADGKLLRRDVQTGADLLPEGRVVITQGLSRGDQVVVAGAAFLQDGQKVVSHKPQTLLHGQSRGTAQ